MQGFDLHSGQRGQACHKPDKKNDVLHKASFEPEAFRQSLLGSRYIEDACEGSELVACKARLPQTFKTLNTEGRFLPSMNAGVSAPNIG